jgi:hypothetical protein
VQQRGVTQQRDAVRRPEKHVDSNGTPPPGV